MNKILEFFKVFWKKYNEDRIFKESAALTYVTLLGFIPFIIFMVFFLPELPFLESEAQVTELTKSIFVPESAAVIFDYITQITSKRIPFNLISFVILLFTSYSLFQIINTTFDNILNARETKLEDVEELKKLKNEILTKFANASEIIFSTSSHIEYLPHKIALEKIALLKNLK